MGGQTALNCALDLVREGVLEKYGVELIAASREAIDMAEDREKFRNAMREIGLESPRSRIAHSMEEALARAGRDRLSDGHSSVVHDGRFAAAASPTTAKSSIEIVERGLDASPTSEVLLEESVLGWKEFEMEVVRDRKDNCIIICSIENFDPMGVHTGDSITVAPAQTLTDKEYQLHAQRLDRGAAQDRRGVRRLERAVRAQSRRRPHADHRNESARVAFLGAGVEGDGFPDRQDRGQAGGRLHAR